jgi:hypothetical protein
MIDVHEDVKTKLCWTLTSRGRITLSFLTVTRSGIFCVRPHHCTSNSSVDPVTLDAKTGLLTGLLTGIQGWKCPVALSQTCYGSKSLKVILMDSNFGGHPVLNPPVTL